MAGNSSLAPRLVYNQWKKRSRFFALTKRLAQIIDQNRITILISLFEPGEGLISIPQAGMDYRLVQQRPASFSKALPFPTGPNRIHYENE